MSRRLFAEKRGYSRAPWRIIDSATGKELTFPVEFDHPHIGVSVIWEAGFDTKQQALDRIGEMAALALPDNEFWSAS